MKALLAQHARQWLTRCFQQGTNAEPPPPYPGPAIGIMGYTALEHGGSIPNSSYTSWDHQKRTFVKVTQAEHENNFVYLQQMVQ